MASTITPRHVIQTWANLVQTDSQDLAISEVPDQPATTYSHIKISLLLHKVWTRSSIIAMGAVPRENQHWSFQKTVPAIKEQLTKLLPVTRVSQNRYQQSKHSTASSTLVARASQNMVPAVKTQLTKLYTNGPGFIKSVPAVKESKLSCPRSTRMTWASSTSS